MSLTIQDAQATITAVGPVQPVPLSERVQARQPQARPSEAFEATLADVSPLDLELPPTPEDAAAAVARAVMTRRDDSDRTTGGANAGAPLAAGALPTVTLPEPVSMLDTSTPTPTPTPRSRPRTDVQTAHQPVVPGTVPGTESATAPLARGSATPGSLPTRGASPDSAAPAAPTVGSAIASIAAAPPSTPAGSVVQVEAGSDAPPAAVQASRQALQPARMHGAAPARASVAASAPAARNHPAPAPAQVAGAKPSQAGAPAGAQSPSDDPATRGDTVAASVAIPAPVSTAPQSETGPDTQSLADARRADANVGTRQQVRAVRQAEALQSAMVQRAEAASQIQVSFSSWGAGHSVTARLDGGRLHMQPSSARVGQALSSATAPAGVELQIAVDGTDTATDERRGDQGQA